MLSDRVWHCQAWLFGEVGMCVCVCVCVCESVWSIVECMLVLFEAVRAVWLLFFGLLEVSFFWLRWWIRFCKQPSDCNSSPRLLCCDLRLLISESLPLQHASMEDCMSAVQSAPVQQNTTEKYFTIIALPPSPSPPSTLPPFFPPPTSLKRYMTHFCHGALCMSFEWPQSLLTILPLSAFTCLSLGGGEVGGGGDWA